MRWLGFVTLIAILSMFAISSVAKNRVSDDEIHDAVKVALASDRDVRGTTVVVAVKDGVVTLKGRVFNQKAKKRAVRIAKKQKGVKKVINELTAPPK